MALENDEPVFPVASYEQVYGQHAGDNGDEPEPEPEPGTAHAVPAPEPAAHPLGGTVPERAVHLPDAFYAARPELAHISRAARARMLGRDAVLGAALARVAALSSHHLRLPAIVGAPCGLSFYVGLIGPSGASKSSAATAAQDLLPCDVSWVADLLPVGSGEGLVECLFDFVEQDNGRKVKEQTRYGAVVYVDEGAVLGELAQRRGSVVLSVLRTAYTHGVLGQTNASAERTRMVPGDRYVYGLTMGIQPELVAPLLNDAPAGTPQRFVWCSATDPAMTDEPADWPGPLAWRRHEVKYAGDMLRVAAPIVAEVRADRLAVMRGEVRDPMDAHRMLVRLKAATLLALLGCRAHVGPDDWHLAGVLMDTSDAVRAGMVATLAAVEHGREQARTNAHVRQELTVDGEREARALLSAARSAGNVVRRHDAEQAHEPERGCTRMCVTRAIGGKYRAVVSPYDAIAEAERRGWIAYEGDRWTPGRSRVS